MTGVIVKEVMEARGGGVRDNMIAGAARLLAQRGLQATSFSTVLAETNAPRGSIYHHFPGGKEELVTAAIEATRAACAQPHRPGHGRVRAGSHEVVPGRLAGAADVRTTSMQAARW